MFYNLAKITPILIEYNQKIHFKKKKNNPVKPNLSNSRKPLPYIKKNFSEVMFKKVWHLLNGLCSVNDHLSWLNKIITIYWRTRNHRYCLYSILPELKMVYSRVQTSSMVHGWDPTFTSAIKTNSLNCVFAYLKKNHQKHISQRKSFHFSSA